MSPDIIEQRARQLDRHGTLVYAIGDSGRVKIGVSKNILKRLRALRSRTGAELDVLGVMRCHKRYGAELQRILAEDRIGGEWFRRTERVDEAIEVLRAGVLPEWLAERSQTAGQGVEL